MNLPTGASRPHPDTTVAEPWPSSRQANYALFLFTLALMFDFLDRSIVTLLVEPIKRDLVLTDTQISLLIGFAYVLFYLVLALPIARLVDSRRRRSILAVGIACWSGFSALCGLAQNFWQLFAARVGVGVGEACNGPATFSMLADLYPKNKLPGALAVLNIGLVAGNGLALILGGYVLYLIAGMEPIAVPFVGTIRPWQMAFIAVGLPGLILAALVARLPEPKRRGLLTHGETAAPIAQRKAVPLRAVARFLADNRGVYLPMFLGLAVSSIVSSGSQAWGPTFFIRSYGWSAAQIGMIQGLVLLLVAPCGLLMGARLAERFARAGHADANMRVLILATAGGIPFTVLYPLMPTAELALLVYAVATFVRFMGPGPQHAALQSITPNEMRGQITALFLFIYNMMGYGIGATFIAVLTDYVFGADDQLRYALALAAGVAGPIAALILWRGLAAYGAAYTRARHWE